VTSGEKQGADGEATKEISGELHEFGENFDS
jgi:hypothetical protein